MTRLRDRVFIDPDAFEVINHQVTTPGKAKAPEPAVRAAGARKGMQGALAREGVRRATSEGVSLLGFREARARRGSSSVARGLAVLFVAIVLFLLWLPVLLA